MMVAPINDGMVIYCRLDGKHVVFGNVTEGIDIVKKIEGYGSQSGKWVPTSSKLPQCHIFNPFRTSKKVVIADCGQL